MKCGWNEIVKKCFAFFIALVSIVLLAACSDDKFAGGTTEDAGLAVQNLNVAGVSQKGPFVKGSVVTVQGVDCRTMGLTDERFEGVVKSDKGDFDVEGISLTSSCAVFEVTGHYLNEITGEKTAEKVTLRALTDLNDRNNVNINLLTRLEFERVVKLVTEKNKSFADAKNQAEKEVLAAFGVEGNFAKPEDMNIFEPGDGNAALLAVSVLMQASNDSNRYSGLDERMDKLSNSIAEDGSWSDSVKSDIADWAAAAKASGQMDAIRKNLERLNYAEEIPAFEKFVDGFVENVASDTGSFVLPSRESFLNPDVYYDTIVDNRDGQVYMSVKIGTQTWMAQNLNYADSTTTPSLLNNSWCMDDKKEYCPVLGRLYTMSAAIDSVKLALDANNPMVCGYGKACTFSDKVQGICPDGWHLPDTTEWHTLIEFVGGHENAGSLLKSQTGWYNDIDGNYNGTDDYGFSAIASGDRYRSGIFTFDGRYASFLTVTEDSEENGRVSYFMSFSSEETSFGSSFKDNGFSVRCVKD